MMQQSRSSQPFQFKHRNKHRFSDNSFKYYRRKAAQEQQDRKKLKRIVRLRRIHLNRAISVKNKGGKWWDKMMYIYFADVTQEDIISCTQNTTSDIMLNFSLIANISQPYSKIITFQKIPQIAQKDIVRIIFHGIVEDSSSSSSSDSGNQDLYQLVGFKYKAYHSQIDIDQCYIIDPSSKQEKPSKKFPVIKVSNIEKQHDMRAQYRINAKLEYYCSIDDERLIQKCISYQQKFKKHHYNHISCQLALFPPELQSVHQINKSLWKRALTNFNKQRKTLDTLHSFSQEITELQTKLSCRNRLLFFKRGLNDKTEDELQQALQQLQVEEKRLHNSRSRHKNSQLASYNDCKICFNPEIREDNLILFCAACKISFHIQCYGLSDVEQPLLYICDGCLYMEKKDFEYDDYSRRPTCQICYSRQEFPLKEIQDHFYHITCLFLFSFVNPTSFQIALKEKDSLQIMKQAKVGHQFRCQYCIPDNIYCGIRFKCSEQGCSNYFHPICAYLRGCKFDITRQQQLSVRIKCSLHTYSISEDDQIRQVYLRRFFCNFENIQKLNEEQFKPLYRDQKCTISIQRRKCERKEFVWQQYDPPLRRRRRQQFQEKKAKVNCQNLSIEEIMKLFQAQSQEIEPISFFNPVQESSSLYFQDEEEKEIVI